ncbi:hypothetical protein B0H66DRAFT_477126 [Apodospora peruviana]|uniref:Nitrate reductase n=1 Tax=Apodospora peruviana TaxID=516989 RepID=A0AAE0I4A5_9PEZI|nr:hypothetical protein B0H66DRAFT_477126 [Apodospora peruviana]
MLQLPPRPVTKPNGFGNKHADYETELNLASPQVNGTVAEKGRPYPLPPRARQIHVLPEDLKTPDNHVERDPRLIRLTGIHPFNVEAPLSDLYDEGFITSKNLHYVRNHGPVPRVEDSEVLNWEFTMEGMVENPRSMTVRDLIRDYDQVTYPVTLVCAGNRRKEQNMVRKSKGFSWGAAGLSTALWTGVSLADLLVRAGPKRGAKYVLMEGADKLPNGSYETSIRLSWAMDPERGVLAAYKMNGEVLHPDHGKPLRIVIPGQIGGRSIKWLKRIVVSSEPSVNWYHHNDNRVLPTMITPEASVNVPEMWKDERYAIYDLNANSAICYPAHDEKVPLSDGPDNTYKFRGYAYAGGGRRVTRMEVTLDQGKTWRLANITYPEDRYRLASDNDTLFGGRVDVSGRLACFCWCFWDLDVPLAQLQDAKDVMIRAMDDSMNVQPRDMYWSVLGMMNNPWYRIVIHREANTLRFEHPTQPALIPGGWMERVKKEGGNLTNGFWGEKMSNEDEPAVEKEPAKEVCMLNKEVNRRITIEELRQHDGEEAPWFVVNGQVYDGTKFLEGHPGGAISIFSAAGQDATEEFLAIHSETARAMMPDYHIGSLDDKALAQLADADSNVDQSEQLPRPVFLQSKVWAKAVLSKKNKVSSDTKIFTFKLDHTAQTIGLPVGQHLMMRLRDPESKEAIIRAYTPISKGTDEGELQVLVKIYYDSVDGRKGGKMTQALDSLPIGQMVEFKGPVGKFEYLGRGQCSIGGKRRQVGRFVMICAGSGITPIFQVLRAVMADRDDKTRCLVLDGNRVEEDILCKAELDKMVEEGNDKEDGNEYKCRVLYTLTRPEASWKGLKGRMDRALFEKEVGKPSAERDAVILVCGPEPMEKLVHQVFTSMGWDEQDLIFF